MKSQTVTLDFVQPIFDSRAKEAADWDSLLRASPDAGAFYAAVDQLDPAARTYDEPRSWAAYFHATQAAPAVVTKWLKDRTAAADRDIRRAN